MPLRPKFECTSNFRPLGNCQWHSCHSWQPPGKLCNCMLILVSRRSDISMHRNWAKKWTDMVLSPGFYLNPNGLCLPSLLVIQSIRRVSRPGRLGKLEKTRLRVNSGPKKKLQSRLSAYPDTQPPTLPLPNEATTSDSAKVNTRYMLTHMTKTHVYCQLSPTSRFWSWYLLRKVSRQFWMLVSMFSAGARLDPCLGRGPAEGNLIWLPGEQHLKMRKMAKKWKRLWIKI